MKFDLNLADFFMNKTKKKQQELATAETADHLKEKILQAFSLFREDVLKANKKYKSVTRKNIKSVTKDAPMRKYRRAKNALVLGFTGRKVKRERGQQRQNGQIVYIPTINGRHVNMMRLNINETNQITLNTDYLFTYLGISGVFCIPTKSYQITNGDELFKTALEKTVISIPEIYQYFDETPLARSNLSQSIEKIDNALSRLRELQDEVAIDGKRISTTPRRGSRAIKYML